MTELGEGRKRLRWPLAHGNGRRSCTWKAKEVGREMEDVRSLQLEKEGKVDGHVHARRVTGWSLCGGGVVREEGRGFLREEYILFWNA